MKQSIFSSVVDALKPNVIIIALIGAFFIAHLSGQLQGEAAQAVSGLAMSFIGGIVGVMFFLVGPPPNPMVPESTALRILGILENSTPAQAKARGSKDGVIIFLIVLGVSIVLYMAVFTDVSDVVIFNLAAFVVGVIASTVGKMADPEATSDQVPQSTVFRIIDLIEKRGSSPKG